MVSALPEVALALWRKAAVGGVGEPCCREALPTCAHTEFELHSEYARSGPCARTLARAWHKLMLEEHPERKAWDDCSEAYRRGLEGRFLRLMKVGMIQ